MVHESGRSKEETALFKSESPSHSKACLLELTCGCREPLIRWFKMAHTVAFNNTTEQRDTSAPTKYNTPSYKRGRESSTVVKNASAWHARHSHATFPCLDAIARFKLATQNKKTTNKWRICQLNIMKLAIYYQLGSRLSTSFRKYPNPFPHPRPLKKTVTQEVRKLFSSGRFLSLDTTPSDASRYVPVRFWAVSSGVS